MSSQSGTDGTTDKAVPADGVSTTEGVAVAAAAATAPSYPKMFSSADKGRYALITLTLINLLNYIDRCQTHAQRE